jgi:plasmid stabilization system protein ParE
VEKEEAAHYQVVVTRKAEIYFYELAEFMYRNMTLDRAEEVITDIQKAVLSLSNLYHRGTKEIDLTEIGIEFRYILVKRTPRSQIKIIYFIDKSAKTVFITDFFPTEKDPKQLVGRNKI